jgi:hypothetical protein
MENVSMVNLEKEHFIHEHAKYHSIQQAHGTMQNGSFLQSGKPLDTDQALLHHSLIMISSRIRNVSASEGCQCKGQAVPQRCAVWPLLQGLGKTLHRLLEVSCTQDTQP